MRTMPVINGRTNTFVVVWPNPDHAPGLAPQVGTLLLLRYGYNITPCHCTRESLSRHRSPVACTTPLGLPVEPEVYSRNSGCSASTHSTGHCGEGTTEPRCRVGAAPNGVECRAAAAVHAAAHLPQLAPPRDVPASCTSSCRNSAHAPGGSGWGWRPARTRPALPPCPHPHGSRTRSCGTPAPWAPVACIRPQGGSDNQGAAQGTGLPQLWCWCWCVAERLQPAGRAHVQHSLSSLPGSLPGSLPNSHLVPLGAGVLAALVGDGLEVDGLGAAHGGGACDDHLRQRKATPFMRRKCNRQGAAVAMLVPRMVAEHVTTCS